MSHNEPKDKPMPEITSEYASQLSRETLQALANMGWDGGEEFYCSGGDLGTIQKLVELFEGDLERYDGFTYAVNKND